MLAFFECHWCLDAWRVLVGGAITALPHAFEFLAVELLIHELAGFFIALGEVLLAHHLGLELRALPDGAIAVSAPLRGLLVCTASSLLLLSNRTQLL